MKTKSKALLLTLCVVLLIAASMLGTMAYLTSTDEVKNTFTVGQVKITLDEAQVDESGNPVEGAARVKANSYKLLPGHTYKKDPIVHVASTSEDCYLFVKVDNQIDAIEATNAKVASQMTQKCWAAVKGAAGVYVYTQNSTPAVVAGGSNVTVFDNFTISGTVDNTTLATYNDKTITVTAYAIQADGFAGKTASEIWTAAGFTN